MTPEYAKAILGLLGVILAFLLNAWWTSVRTGAAKREEDATYRGEVRGHMCRMEKFASEANETLNEFREFKGHVTAIIHRIKDSK